MAFDANNQIGLDASEMDSIDHWTRLIRSNLSRVVHTTDSDSEETGHPTIDEEILNAPRRKSTRHNLAQQVASNLYPAADPDSLASLIRYEKDVVMLRSIVLEQRREAIADATKRNAKFDWAKRISKQGPWDPANKPLSLKGAPSLPMPVEVSDKETLAPFFAHLRNGGTHEPASTTSNNEHITTGIDPYYGTELIEFEKGVLYADHRLDLCKMVTGPRNIGDLMESLKPNTFSKHFLLGNNIIGPTGARAIADFVAEHPDRFETWYLAGNCIDGVSFSILVDSLIKSEAVTNVWLKRNPLGEDAAADVVRLVTHAPNLRTVDLDQTELGDAGVAKLFSALANHESPLALRNIYLNATGVGENACQEIARYLASPHCTLQSLYMSTNPVGNAGAAALAKGLEVNKSLKRLSMQSCGLCDVACPLDALSGHVTLETLDLGQSYATEDLGMQYNWIENENVPAIVKFINTTPHLKYLNLSYTPISQSELNKVHEAVIRSSLVWYQAKSLCTGGKEVASVKAGQENVRLNILVRERLHANVQKQYGVDYVRSEAEHKRFLTSPTDVRLIDSVYRNRDAGAARRGLKRLQKWWDEGDETLKQVQEGTFE